MPDKHKRRLKRLRESLSECTLLLKKDGRFPLEGSCRIALYGNGARGTLKGGTGSGDVNSLFFYHGGAGPYKRRLSDYN